MRGEEEEDMTLEMKLNKIESHNLVSMWESASVPPRSPHHSSGVGGVTVCSQQIKIYLSLIKIPVCVANMRNGLVGWFKCLLITVTVDGDNTRCVCACEWQRTVVLPLLLPGTENNYRPVCVSN